MENLKYADILQLNKVMRNNIKGNPYRITFLSNITITSVKEILEYVLRINKINPIVEFGNYDNIVQDSSKCNESNLVIIFYNLRTVVESLNCFFEDISEQMYNDLKNRILSELDIIFNNLENTPSVIFNLFSLLDITSSNLRKSKIEFLVSTLNEYVSEKKTLNFNLVNTDKIISQNGITYSIDNRLFFSSKALFTLTFFKSYVSVIEPVILRNTGRLKKAIIFDCDNTLWKGILGEDGFEKIDMSRTSNTGRIFNSIQFIAAYLNKRGVIIGLCSKNNESDVSEVLMNHPDMILKDNFITIKKINWSDKVSNLKEIASDLNIGLDSLVFVDDSKFEINLINEQLPDVITLQVPVNLYEYPDHLLKLVYKYFNFSGINEDAQKTEIYKQQFFRESEKKKYNTIEEFLASLKISVSISINNENLIPRIAQLTQKTNQFNLTTKRYTENQILTFMKSSCDQVFALSVKDKFGDSGLTGVCILCTNRNDKSNVIIDTFLMSCRIIGRNIEYAFFDRIVKWLNNNQFLSISSEFIPTKKNEQVEHFYEGLGFKSLGNNIDSKKYLISVQDYKMKSIEYITVEE